MVKQAKGPNRAHPVFVGKKCDLRGSLCCWFNFRKYKTVQKVQIFDEELYLNKFGGLVGASFGCNQFVIFKNFYKLGSNLVFLKSVQIKLFLPIWDILLASRSHDMWERYDKEFGIWTVSFSKEPAL